MNLYRFALVAIFFAQSFFAFAQSPQGINYQAALRDSETGEAFKNEMVVMLVTIRDGGPSGEVVYSETHPSIQTSEFGLINIVIGEGDVADGSFSDIPWSSGDIWYEIEVDSGSGFESLGSVKFVSVPYALFAANAEESLDNDPTNELITSAVYDTGSNAIVLTQANGSEVVVSLSDLNTDDADADPSNELITSASYSPENNSIDIQQADGSVVNISLDNLSVADADADPTNELITSGSYDTSDNSIKIQQANNSEVTISLDNFDVADADADPTNELINSAIYNAEQNEIVITQGDGSQLSISLSDLSVADADSDPNNELIDDAGLTFDGSNLSISEAGLTYSVNLSSLKDDADPDPTNELIDANSFELFEDTILRISENGIQHSVNVASLKEDEDWKIESASNIIYNEQDRVGIGTSAPQAKLHVSQSVNSEPLMTVISGADTLLHAENQSVGLRTSSTSSAIQMRGSIGFNSTILSNSDADNYTAGIDDHMIVVSFQAGGNSIYTLNLPGANTCQGRVYYIRKTGAPGNVGDVNIDTAGFAVDFSGPDLVLSENGPQTTVLLSLGDDGWTRILRED